MKKADCLVDLVFREVRQLFAFKHPFLFLFCTIYFYLTLGLEQSPSPQSQFSQPIFELVCEQCRWSPTGADCSAINTSIVG
jgi:hypothetical protein